MFTWTQQFWQICKKTLSAATDNSIEYWVLLRMAALLIALGAFFLLVAIYFLSLRFDAHDAEHYKNKILRVDLVLAQDRHTLEATLGDYSHWDETVNFILGKNAGYIATNMSGTSLNTLDINAVAFTKLDATPASAIAVSNDGTIGDMSPAMLAVVTPFFKRATQAANKESLTSVLWLNGAPILATALPITDAHRKNPASGYMFMFRNLSGKYLQQIQQVTSVPFALVPAKALPKQAITMKQSGAGANKTWAVNQSLANLPLQINVSGPTSLLKERRTAYWLLAANAAALIAFALAGIYFILEYRILRRLKEFSQLANRQRAEGNPDIRWPMQGSDELDNLSMSLNGLMGEISAKHQDLRFLAEHDSLTGVGNRRKLYNRLEAVRNRSLRMPSLTSSLVLLDIDNFKLVNDGMGHAVGDMVLQEIAGRIHAMTRSYDTVARLVSDETITELEGNNTVVRLGGDEFAVLLEDSEPSKVLSYTERLLKRIEQPIELEGRQSLVVRGSIGIALVDAALSKEDIVRNADLAMYEAKRRGKGQIAMFDVGLLSTTFRRLHLEQALKQALDAKLLEVWFQPIVAPEFGDVVGMEALSRWSLDENYISPVEFIPIAENTGMIGQLGRLVFDQVGAALKGLRAHYPNLQCSINLSIRQFHDTDLISDISACLRKYDLPADALKLELTESMIVEHEHEVLPTMLKLVAMGCKFYLDDFGTGYSSLDRLRTLPFNVLKIDRSFVTSLRNGDNIIVRNIINIGRELGMELIAEGVETEEELSKLIALGCDQFQGYYFAKPMPLADLHAWLSAQEKLSNRERKTAS